MRLASYSFIALVAILTGCSEPEVVESRPRPVVSMIVEQPIDQSSRSFSGLVSAGDATNLAFEVSGRIESIGVGLGETAQAGDILASVDKTDYPVRVADAEAALAQAESELLRTQKLFETGNASQSQLDSAIRGATSARASFELAERQLKNTDLRMPFDGIVSSVELETQELATTGQTVMRIQKQGSFEFHFGVPTDLVNALKVGQELKVLVNDGASEPLSATILRIAPGSNTDTTYTVESGIQDSPETLREGMVGEVTVETKGRQSEPYFSLPLAAIIGGGTSSQPSVWLLKPDDSGNATVHNAEVSTGFLLSDGYIAVTSGLTPGDILVTRGVNEIKEGMVVRYAQ